MDGGINKMNNLFNKILIRLKRKTIVPKMHVYKPFIVKLDKHSEICIENYLTINNEFDQFRQIHNRKQASLICQTGSKLKVGGLITRPGTRIVIYDGGELLIGQKVRINYDSVIECFCNITIGDETLISESVMIRDSNNHMIMHDGYKVNAPVVIGKHVWICAKATILPGVTIGDGAIIAAGSLVNKDVPPKTLVAGVPAKVVRTNIEWKE